MSLPRPRTTLPLVLALAFIAVPSIATIVQRLSLEELLNRSGKVFRGTVMEVRSGFVEIGGGRLPTVTYVFKVDEAFKGVDGDEESAKVVMTMAGTLKTGPVRVGQYEKFSALPEVPKLTIGSDYLLITTPESEAGLSAPVGLGQGLFAVFMVDRQDFAVNSANNQNLDIGATGAIPYSELAAKIRSMLGQ